MLATELGMAFSLANFNTEPEFKEIHKKVFFGYGPFIDQYTVALSMIRSDGIISGVLPYNCATISGKGKHAEIAFIEQADRELKQIIKSRSYCNITIVMMLSKSPCFNCREELEVFFEKWTRNGVQIRYILRIGNLYHGNDQKEDVIISKLASWLRYLTGNNIVCEVLIEPISVTIELSTYTPRKIIEPPDSWETAKQHRKARDADIKTSVGKIQAEIQNPPMNPPPVEIIYPSLKEFSQDESLDANGKRLFYWSCPQPLLQATVVTLGQIRVNAMGRDKSKLHRHIEITKLSLGCCGPISQVWDKITNFPKCWTLTQIHLTLMFSNCPCIQCLYRILERLTEMAAQMATKQLTLRIANFCLTTEMAEWMVELEKRNIIINLEPITVMAELPRVNKPNETLRQDWEQVKQDRRDHDLTIKTRVEDIYSEKGRMQQPPVDSPAVDDLTTQFGTLTLPK